MGTNIPFSLKLFTLMRSFKKSCPPELDITQILQSRLLVTYEPF